MILDEGLIGRIDISGTTKTRDWVLRRELPMTDSSVFTIQNAKQGMTNLNATNLFEQVILTAHHEGEYGGKNVLTLQARERNTDLISFGLRVDNERNIQPSLDLRDENFLGTGSEFRNYGGRRFKKSKLYRGIEDNADFQFLFDLRPPGIFPQ